MRPFPRTQVRTVGVAFACLGLAAGSAEAVAPRAYVSVTGSDANVCSNPATPCRTFTGAIAQTTSGGEVIVLNSGTFGGGSITQAVTINAPAGVAALAATPIVVNAGATDVVTLRGITFVAPIPGADTALTFSGGAVLNVEKCVFHGWNTGIYAWKPGKLNVVDTTVRDSFYGILMAPDSGILQGSFERIRLLGNNYGLRAASRAKATIKDSLMAGHASVAVWAEPIDPDPAEINVENCVSTNNLYGVEANDGGAGGAATVRIANSTLTDNNVGIAQVGSSVILSRVNNTIEGNGTNVFGTLTTYTAK